MVVSVDDDFELAPIKEASVTLTEAFLHKFPNSFMSMKQFVECFVALKSIEPIKFSEEISCKWYDCRAHRISFSGGSLQFFIPIAKPHFNDLGVAYSAVLGG